MLDLDDNEYSVEVALKYVYNNEVIPITKKFNKKFPFVTQYTTTKDIELLAFKQQNQGLKNKLGDNEHLFLKTGNEIKNLSEKIKLIESEILAKSDEIKQNKVLLNEMGDKLALKESQLNRTKMDLDEKNSENKKLQDFIDEYIKKNGRPWIK